MIPLMHAEFDIKTFVKDKFSLPFCSSIYNTAYSSLLYSFSLSLSLSYFLDSLSKAMLVLIIGWLLIINQTFLALAESKLCRHTHAMAKYTTTIII